MARFFFPLAALALLAFPSLLPAQAVRTPTAALKIRSVEAALSDFRYLTALAGDKSLAGKVVGAVGLVVVTISVVLALAWIWDATRWSIKIGTDVDAGLVDLNNLVKIDVATLGALERPAPLPRRRRARPIETSVYVVSATLVQFKREPDGDYHLVLKGQDGSTMICEIPNPRFVGGSPFRDHIVKARAAFTARFHVTTSWQSPDVPVVVTGIGLFDVPHGQHRPATNFIELHPVLDIQFP